MLDTFWSVYQKIDISIDFFGNTESEIQIINTGIDFFNSTNPVPDTVTRINWLGQSIPILFSDNASDPVFTISKNSILINYDIVSSAFYLLSGWQEFHSKELDQHHRFKYSASFQSKYDCILLPIVNYYFDILKSAIESITGKKLKRRFNPDSSYLVSISHDIDKINTGWKQDAFSMFKKIRLSKVFSILLSKLRGVDTWNNLEELIDLERSLNIRSTFYFLAKKGKNNSDYSIKEVEHIFPLITRNGSEVGIHGSYGSGKYNNQLVEDINNLPHAITGNRFHYLACDPSNWIEIMQRSDLKYDSTLCFAEHIGFRNGFCLPFRPYDHSEKKASNFIEIPLMIMDTTLRDKMYMGSKEDPFKLVNNLINEVQKFNGICTVLWHNNYFTPYKFDGWSERFLELIERFNTDEAVFLTSNEIATHYLNG